MKTSVASEMKLYEKEMGEVTGENLSSTPQEEQSNETKEPSTVKEVITEIKGLLDNTSPAKKKSLAPKLVQFGITKSSDIPKQTDIDLLKQILEVVRGL